MTLAARLIVAFGIVAVLATALVGISLREASRDIIERDFGDRIDAAASGVQKELSWEASSLRDLLAPLCEHDTFVDKAHLDLDRAHGDANALEPSSKIAIRHFVPDQARALRLDELSLVTGGGVILGAEDVVRIGTKDGRLAALIKNKPGSPRFKTDAAGIASLEVHCSRSSNGVTIGLVGARKIATMLERVGAAYGVSLSAAKAGSEAPRADPEYVVRTIEMRDVDGLNVYAEVPRDRLKNALMRLDRAIWVTGAVAVVLALVVAVLLARSLSQPLAALAKETREIVAGAPRRVEGRGGREIAQLADAFNRSIEELVLMRQRLSVSERIAAQREVARQIAHEIKNPLAPIRAAMETLRRLRARDDPAFDEYFEEATGTVLEEVHRISNIVTEFTKFARLPAPNPEPVDLVNVAKGVVTLHARSADATGPSNATRVELVSEPGLPLVVADKDQIVQVLTNLVQNGLDAASAARPDPRVVVTIGPLEKERIRIVVRDNGPGVSDDMLPRLFTPYATTKAKGTGLGLAIVQRIVFEHGGDISYRKPTKGGAVFEIWLPLGGPPMPPKPVALPEKADA
ncbi:MAG: HAMP domain-containing protein [Polyangiaceae bacterium]|nr:HAMP domain-containing protein [Polyangiaceae bacterium]